MKRILIGMLSFMYILSGYCQSKVLFLKSKDVIKFQTWDTIYATVRNNRVVLSDTKGNRYKLKLTVDELNNTPTIMVSGNRYHLHGKPCQNGVILMDERMTLFFEEKSTPLSYFSSFVDHGSHHSHVSHRSHYSSVK